METKYLATLVTIVETGSFQKAAVHLNYAPSTVTAQIKQLEEEFGFPLFERVGRKMELTQAGRDIMPFVQSILQNAEKITSYNKSPSQLTGTLRLGIDMSRADDRWFEARGDTAVLRLPDVGLLDDNFIDETRTRAFYEKGSWPAAELDRLYERARTAMLRRHLTKAHLDEARQSAREQFTRIFQGLGFTTVDVSFVPPSNKTKQA